MKFFTKKSVVQKIVIALILVISFNFSVPVKVQADAGGVLVSPLVAVVTVIFDGIQHLLEWAMLGETHFFMQDKENAATLPGKPSDASYDISKLNGGEKELKFDGEIWGLGDYAIPVIQYTPEEIFSNRVPALDINFITPSVRGGEERNVAVQLQPVISSWYTAIRTLALVGLLSVLVYLGIRMLLTSVAADRAKYKKMLWDWLVAMCLVFALHYIMSFALTMAETVTAMLSSNVGQTVAVTVPDGTTGTTFNTNLMGFVRFMIQCTDLQQKLTFLGLYIILVIYSIRFTWIYLKRVANMAFLTLFAPVVALTYPIDKVTDGKAQAFNMWIKEFTYNALLQPLHLLIYIVLVSSAMQLAIENPLYAIVCLGFILAAEKLLKKMFGFDKASGGTLGSLAGAAGVTAMAGKALNSFAQGKLGGGGNSQKGKIRTKDNFEREGKDKGVNSAFDAFDGKTADQVIGSGGSGANETPTPPPLPDSGDEQQNAQGPQQDTLDDLEQQRAELYNQGYTDNSDEIKAINEKIQNGEWIDEQAEDAQQSSGEENPQDLADLRDRFATSGEREDSLWDVMKKDTGNFLGRGKDKLNTIGSYIGKGQDKQDNRERLKRNLKNSIGDGIRRRAIGAWKAAPTVAYKAARGTLKTASRVALAGAMGGLGLAIGATTGDGDKAISMALGAGGVGFATGDNLFEATAGKAMKDKSIRDAYGAGKYGNAIDARNAKADKAYIKSQKFDDFYEKNFKGKYDKKKMQEIVTSYRQAGITSEKDIKRAIKLEEKYKAADSNLSEKDAREQVQNIVQSYGDIDLEKKAFTDDKVKQKEIDRIAGMLKGGANPQNKKVAEQIFKGYEDWRNT